MEPRQPEPLALLRRRCRHPQPEQQRFAEQSAGLTREASALHMRPTVDIAICTNPQNIHILCTVCVCVCSPATVRADGEKDTNRTPIRQITVSLQIHSMSTCEFSLLPRCYSMVNSGALIIDSSYRPVAARPSARHSTADFEGGSQVGEQAHFVSMYACSCAYLCM